MSELLSLNCKYGDLKLLISGEYELSLILPKTAKNSIFEVVDTLKQLNSINLTLSKVKRKRSLEANDFCWVMCRKIAEVTNATKVEVYRHHIREVGQFAPLPIKTEVVERFAEVWSQKGIGWFVDIVDDSKLPGYKKVFAYYGSSTYDTREMSLLIDNIIQDCNGLGIPTITEAEAERLKGMWGKSAKA